MQVKAGLAAVLSSGEKEVRCSGKSQKSKLINFRYTYMVEYRV